jgi:signal transduction histidine kinase/CheY-like chemotaxis protein
VSVADLRNGSLPVSAPVCVDGVATYNDVTKAVLVMQDPTGGIRFGNVDTEDAISGQRVEVCGETRQGTGGMSLAGAKVKMLGQAGLPKPVVASAGEWTRGTVDWKWVEIQGLAYAESCDWLSRATLHMVTGGRRVQVYVIGRADPPAFPALMGAKVRVQGVARPADAGGTGDLILFCPGRQLITVDTPANSGDSLPLLSVASAARLAGPLPAERVRLRGAVSASGADGAWMFADATGQLRLRLPPVPLVETGDVEITAFPVHDGSMGTLVGPVIARVEKPAERRLIETVHELHTLSRQEAALGLPARLRAVATYVEPLRGLLFVQDRTGGTFVWLGIRPSVDFAVGDVVEVVGATDPGDYAPLVREAHVRRLGPGKLPDPPIGSLYRLFSGHEDSNWIETEGTVTSVGEREGSSILTLVEGDRSFEANVSVANPHAGEFLNARIRLTGVCAAKLNARRQLAGIRIFVPGWKNITVLSKAGPIPAADSATPIGDLLKYSAAEPSCVRVRGVLTLAPHDGPAYVQDSTAGVQVETTAPVGLPPGATVEAVGFPAAGPFSAVLENAEIRRASRTLRIEPADISADDALAGAYDSQLVRMEGTVVNHLDTFADQVLAVEDGDRLFDAHLPYTGKEVSWPGTGARVRLTGVCSVRVEERSGEIVPIDFNLYLRSPGDMTVVQAAPWWSTRHILELLAVTATVVLVCAIWILLLRKRVQMQTGIIKEKLAQEERLREAAEAASRSKSEFLANMSHEIRTPMNGVIGMTGVLLDTALTPQQKDCAETVRRSGEALLGVINDILDFSKIEAGKLAIEPHAFDLRLVLEEVYEMLAPQAEDKQLALILEYPSSLPRHFVGDAGRIRQIVTNLVGNAVKFTPSGQILTTINCGVQDGPKALLQVSVRDSGPGIPADKVGSLFKKFSQADSSTTRRFGGTGLGLAISKQLVELMGGAIGVNSRAGEGCTFWFTLPLELDACPEAEPLPSGELRNLRVLIVDDNELSRRAIHEQIASWGMRNGGFGTANGLLDALREARKSGDPYHFAIVDCQVSGIEGATLAAAIKNDPEVCDTVVILLAPIGRQSETRHLEGSLIDASLVKPVRQSQLMNALATAWSRKLGKPFLDGPTPQSPNADVESSAAARFAGRTVRVLVAEDNVVNQKVAALMLRRLGIRADFAANGREAVEMFAMAPYDLIFMDCQMPQMDGYEAAREIRRREGAAHRVAIVAMTADAMEGARETCFAAGMDDYVSKPVKRNDLLEKVEKWVQVRQAAPEP